MDAKSLFQSKTFWINLVTGVLAVAGVLPPQVSIPVIAAANIILRVVSGQPVTVPLPFLKVAVLALALGATVAGCANFHAQKVLGTACTKFAQGVTDVKSGSLDNLIAVVNGVCADVSGTSDVAPAK
jgi:hypothetical protein